MILTIEATTAQELRTKILSLADTYTDAYKNVPTQLELTPQNVNETTPQHVNPNPEPIKKSAGRPKKTAAAEPVAPTAPQVQPEPVMPTPEDLRAAFEKVAGEENENIEAVRGILERFGARKMSEVKREDYPALVKACNDYVAQAQA